MDPSRASTHQSLQLPRLCGVCGGNLSLDGVALCRECGDCLHHCPRLGYSCAWPCRDCEELYCAAGRCRQRHLDNVHPDREAHLCIDFQRLEGEWRDQDDGSVYTVTANCSGDSCDVETRRANGRVRHTFGLIKFQLEDEGIHWGMQSQYTLEFKDRTSLTWRSNVPRCRNRTWTRSRARVGIDVQFWRDLFEDHGNVIVQTCKEFRVDELGGLQRELSEVGRVLGLESLSELWRLAKWRHFATGQDSRRNEWNLVAWERTVRAALARYRIHAFEQVASGREY